MRITGGRLKGRIIEPPKSFEARPTTDFAKEGLFNILQNHYDFSTLGVLDLFAGSGSISFEFISRGCPDVTAIEMHRPYVDFIRRTAKDMGVDQSLQVVRHNVFDFLSLCRRRYSLVFADPPYRLEGVDRLPGKIFDSGILEPDALFVLEHSKTYNFTDAPHFLKEKKYGKVHFSFFC